MAQGWWRGLFAGALLVGCGDAVVPGDVAEDPMRDVTDDSEGSGRDDAPAAEWIDAQGQRYLRIDLWEPSELDRVQREGDARLPSDDVYTLAAQLRAQAYKDGGHYIQVELNLSMAERILRGPPPADTPNAPTLEVRGIYGTDDRGHVTNPSVDPSPMRGFSEAGCSSGLVSRHVAATAAHCVFKSPDSIGNSGWVCGNGTYGGTCPRLRWRFGVEDNTGYSPWLSCAGFVVPTAWTTIPYGSGAYTYTRWDYAILDISYCPSYGMGYFGTRILSDATMVTKAGYAGGYPGYATCPTGAAGTETDCGSSVYGNPYPIGPHYRYGTLISGFWSEDLFPPFGGAEIWTSVNRPVSLGTSQPAHTLSCQTDVTKGQSGGPLVETGTWWVLGITHGGGDTGNLFHRWNTETHNFFDANSIFPPATDP